MSEDEGSRPNEGLTRRGNPITLPSRFFSKYLLLALAGIAALSSVAYGQKAMPKPGSDPAAVAADPQVRAVVAANTEFGFAVLGQLSRSAPDKNVFFSPFGISNALTVAFNGAGGTTAHDMAATLGLGALTQDQINQGNGLLLSSLGRLEPNIELSVANALWSNNDTAFDPDFQDRCFHYYAAHIETLDFVSPDAADTINGWVKESTHGKIAQIVSSSDLTGAKVVLTNAVYFRGPWQAKFTKADTKDGPFTLGTGQTKPLPMMSQVALFPYLDTPDFQAVSLPYGSGRLSFYVFLPKPGSDLNVFVNGLTKTTWEGWIGKMKPMGIKLFLPRFQVNSQTTLNSSLTALGMGAAFAPGADFTPMGLDSSFISTVVHKAVLKVDEEGTVAAAATSIGFGGLGGGGRPLPIPTLMRVDHPFFCAIRDNTTGTLLFAGVIRDPN